MWVTKLLISPVKKRIFCPKTTRFGPKLAFLVNLDQAMQAYSVPCWWVGWWLWRAGCISQDTYLLYWEMLLSYLFVIFCLNLSARISELVKSELNGNTHLACKRFGTRLAVNKLSASHDKFLSSAFFSFKI